MIRFPDSFLWGAATASYQIEGSPTADGAGASVWHRFAHTPGTIQRAETGDTACDHYRRWRDDVAMMKSLGFNAYRFSTAWGRVLPEGTGTINEKGVDFYRQLVDALLENGIEPMITLFHWDLPAALQDRGGWANRESADWFTEYAEVMFRALGDRVKWWVTHNEPWVVMMLGHITGEHAPGIRDIGAASRAGHHLLLGHAQAVQAFRAHQPAHAQIGLVTNLGPQQPASDNPMDQMAAELWHNFINRLFLDPVFKGSYPQIMLDFLGEFAPPVQAGDLERIQQPIDFLGVNYYTRNVVAYDPDSSLNSRSVLQEAQHTEMGWEVYPEGLYQILKWVQATYGDIPLYITENGAAFADQVNEQGEIEDRDRLEYLKSHFSVAYRAMQEGVPLKGYFAWSLMDNFEWAFGYSKRFGMVHVDFATLKRTVKASGHWYSQVIQNHGF
ncbi:MAG: beta-glucosidase [Fimbriimonadia bacterium]|nr:beta-glucosidase [Fimbriimonadia bacterium]